MKQMLIIFAVFLVAINLACGLTSLSEQQKSLEDTPTSIVTKTMTPSDTPSQIEATATLQPTNTSEPATPTATYTLEPTFTPEPTPTLDEISQLSDTLPVKETVIAERIAYSYIDDEDYDIYVMNADGSNPIRLTDNPANEMYPIWSPDNKRLAYIFEQEGLWEIYVVNADGSDQRRLAEGKDPAWSPDSQQLAFVSQRDGVGEIYLINIDGSELRRLTDGFAPAWSPDGQKIAFETGDVDSKIYVVNVDGSNPKHIIDTAGGPAWSPDGNQIAFTSYYNVPPPKIYVVNADGSNLNRLADGAAPVWAPDGSRIAFLDISDLSDVRYTSYNVINADGTEQSIIISGLPQMRNVSPSWSPDSQQIVVVSGRAGPLGVDVINVDGSGGYGNGSLTRLTDQSGFYAFPAWSHKQGEDVESIKKSDVETPTDVPASSGNFYPLSLGEVVNGGTEVGYKSPPLGEAWLGDTLFNLPSGQNSVTTQAEPLPDYPISVHLTAEVLAPKQVSLLITGGNTFTRFSGQVIGTIQLYFAQGQPISIPLIAGQNIREWKLLDDQTVSTTSSSQVTEVWRTESNFGGIGIIDCLTIDLPDSYHSDTLVSIEIIDESINTVGSMDPAINLLGVTVFGR